MGYDTGIALDRLLDVARQHRIVGHDVPGQVMSRTYQPVAPSAHASLMAVRFCLKSMGTPHEPNFKKSPVAPPLPWAACVSAAWLSR
jgi:hypothetical protein